MINAGTVLNVVNNTGILKARCIKVYGNTKKKYAKVVDVILKVVVIVKGYLSGHKFHDNRINFGPNKQKIAEVIQAVSGDFWFNGIRVAGIRLVRTYNGLSKYRVTEEKVKSAQQNHNIFGKFYDEFSANVRKAIELAIKGLVRAATHAGELMYLYDEDGNEIGCILQTITSKESTEIFDIYSRDRITLNNEPLQVEADGMQVFRSPLSLQDKVLTQNCTRFLFSDASAPVDYETPNIKGFLTRSLIRIHGKDASAEQKLRNYWEYTKYSKFQYFGDLVKGPSNLELLTTYKQQNLD